MTMMTITKVTMMAEMTDKTMMTRREDDGVSAASSHPCGHQEQQTVVSLCIILHCIVHNAHILYCIIHAFCAQCPIKCHQEQQLVVSLSIGDHVHYIALPKPACVCNAQCAMCILCNNQMSPTVANTSPSMHIVTTCNKLCCH